MSLDFGFGFAKSAFLTRENLNWSVIVNKPHRDNFSFFYFLCYVLKGVYTVTSLKCAGWDGKKSMHVSEWLDSKELEEER